jgi:ribosome-binding protein aMBF1 (putative translation factor)
MFETSALDLFDSFIFRSKNYYQSIGKRQEQSVGKIQLVFMGRKPKERRNRYGAWLQHLRNQKGLSQDALSEMTGVPQSTIAYWEKSGELAGRKTIFKIAKALDVSVGELLRENNP